GPVHEPLAVGLAAPRLRPAARRSLRPLPPGGLLDVPALGRRLARLHRRRQLGAVAAGARQAGSQARRQGPHGRRPRLRLSIIRSGRAGSCVERGMIMARQAAVRIVTRAGSTIVHAVLLTAFLYALEGASGLVPRAGAQ